MSDKPDINKIVKALERILGDRHNVDLKITPKKKRGRPRKN